MALDEEMKVSDDIQSQSTDTGQQITVTRSLNTETVTGHKPAVLSQNREIQPQDQRQEYNDKGLDRENKIQP